MYLTAQFYCSQIAAYLLFMFTQTYAKPGVMFLVHVHMQHVQQDCGSFRQNRPVVTHLT